jgi:hypothetical protein
MKIDEAVEIMRAALTAAGAGRRWEPVVRVRPDDTRPERVVAEVMWRDWTQGCSLRIDGHTSADELQAAAGALFENFEIAMRRGACGVEAADERKATLRFLDVVAATAGGDDVLRTLRYLRHALERGTHLGREALPGDRPRCSATGGPA